MDDPQLRARLQSIIAGVGRIAPEWTKAGLRQLWYDAATHDVTHDRFIGRLSMFALQVGGQGETGGGPLRRAIDLIRPI